MNQFDVDEYQAWAATLWKKKDDIHLDIMHALLGLTTEVGEVADLFKKPWFTPNRVDGRTVADVQELKKEIGDVLYYAAILAEIHGIPLSDVVYSNVTKLEKRYGAQTSNPTSSELENPVSHNLHGAV
jgi:NTP pyrophosphatase (non-canonical NTP hydrolase)